MTIRRAGPIALILLALFAPAGAHAQGRGGPPPQRAEMERRVRERFGEMVRAELGLTQEQLARVDEVVASFQERREGLMRRQVALSRSLDRGGAAPADDEATTLLREMAAVREEEARLFRAEMDGLRAVLTPAQTLRFYSMRDQLMDRVRRLRQDAPGRGGPPGPRGAPPRGG